jgi:hypothetical protein
MNVNVNVNGRVYCNGTQHHDPNFNAVHATRSGVELFAFR